MSVAALPVFRRESKYGSDNAVDRTRYRYSVMSTPDKKHVGYYTHVGDCYIWSEIYYLNSPTDYRECLPGHRISPCNISRSGFSILASSENTSSHLCLGILVLLASCLMMCYVFWGNLQ